MIKSIIKPSLIIATYNWNEALELVLLSVLIQTEKPYEVIIADDGSKGDAKELVNNFKTKFPFPLIHVWHKDKGFRLAEIRNKAIKKASGNYIIQIDGDTILHKHFIKDHRKYARKGHFISGTRVLLGKAISQKLFKSKRIKVHFFTKDITNIHYTLRIPFFTNLLKSPSDDIEKVIHSVRGCNMSFWKDDLLKVNGYDENITEWGREDSELSARLINNGLKKIYLKFSAIQFHIFHTSQAKDNLTLNDSVLKNTLIKNKIYTLNGIKKTGRKTNSLKKKITAIIPTFNEEKNIEAAIKAVLFADEILLIDSYSTDATLEIAKKYDVRILQRKFDDFSSQKNFAISKASHDWTLLLDADEQLSEELNTEIIASLTNTATKNAYWIYRENFFSNRKINFSGWQNDKVIRLFDRKTCRYDGKLVHEEIKNEGSTGYLKGKLLHYSCDNKDFFKEKIVKYAILKAKELYLEEVKPKSYHLYIKPIYRFFYHYIFKLGFLDGKIGFIIASTNAYGIKKRYEELYKLHKANKK